MKVILYIFCFSLFLSLEALGQETPKSDYRPKIAEFSIINLYDYYASSTSERFGNARTEVENEQQFKTRLGIPIIYKGNTLLGVQLKYDKHKFVLDNDGAPYDLYDHIESRRFTSVGGRFILSQNINDNKKLTVIAGAELKSDKVVWNSQTAKYYLNVVYEKQLNAQTKIGGGISAAMALGRPQIYPFLNYERQINPKWTVDLSLPKRTTLRFKTSDKFYVIGNVEVKGWRYALNENDILENQTLTLRKADLQIGLRLERELHDWLWAGVDFGMIKNLRYFLVEPGDGRRNALIDLRSGDAPYLKLGIFMVPPRKFYSK